MSPYVSGGTISEPLKRRRAIGRGRTQELGQNRGIAAIAALGLLVLFVAQDRAQPALCFR